VSPVAVGRDTVVTLRVELHDAHGALIDAPEQPIGYLHGGYGGLLDALERALEGRGAGESVLLQLEPEQAFGEYDAALVHVEALERYGEGLQIGMEVEDRFGEEEPRIYRVTDLAAGKVVLDANHPLAGMALRFTCTILAVRAASAEELGRGAPDPSP
jgi:FKBP-type peptidyl-prolyl cis-trans isomerase SlyD